MKISFVFTRFERKFSQQKCIRPIFEVFLDFFWNEMPSSQTLYARILGLASAFHQGIKVLQRISPSQPSHKSMNFLRIFFTKKCKVYMMQTTGTKRAWPANCSRDAKHLLSDEINRPYSFHQLSTWFLTLMNIDPAMTSPAKIDFWRVSQVAYSQRIVDIELQMLAYVQHSLLV